MADTSTARNTSRTGRVVAPFPGSSRRPISDERARLIQMTVQVAGALAMLVFIVVLALEIGDARERLHFQLQPEAIRTIDEIGGAIDRHDRNGDYTLEGDELDFIAEWERLDRNSDGRVSSRDAFAPYVELRRGPFKDAYPTLTEWKSLGGSSVAFGIFDRDGDGRLSEEELLREAAIATPTRLAEVVDTRTGEKLLLGPLRNRWLNQVIQNDERNLVPWAGRMISINRFESGRYGTVIRSDGSTIAGFVEYRERSTEFRVFAYDGRTHKVQRTGAKFVHQPEAPAAKWFGQHIKLNPRKVDEWRALALLLVQDNRLHAQAQDAARRALIYNPTLADLYEIAGCQREGEILVATE